MEILGVLIILMMTAVLAGKFKLKSETNKYVIAAVIALLQVIYVAYKMLTMKMPWLK